MEFLEIQKSNPEALKNAVDTLIGFAKGKNFSGEKNRQLDSLEIVKFTIICEATALVLSDDWQHLWNTEKMEDARMEERTNVIKLRYARNSEPVGREYTFYTPEPVEVGNEVVIDVISQNRCSYGIVTAVDVPLAEIEPFGARAKTIVGKAPEREQEAAGEATEAAEKQLLQLLDV